MGQSSCSTGGLTPPDARDGTGLLASLIAQRARLMIDVAASKAAKNSTCVFDGAREMAVLQAANVSAANNALPLGPSLILAQLQADCAKQIEEHYIISWGADPIKPKHTLDELRSMLNGLNMQIFATWRDVSRPGGEWQVSGCGAAREKLVISLQTDLASTWAASCAAGAFREMIVTTLLMACDS